ncbi:hypothetical protein B5F40_13905 [Gordonibacter sp. An230]|nr:hypothetical protein B5F40_13905 [Gordonibacter sp. An230]
MLETAAIRRVDGSAPAFCRTAPLSAKALRGGRGWPVGRPVVDGEPEDGPSWAMACWRRRLPSGRAASGGRGVAVGLPRRGAGDSAAVSLRSPSPRVAAVEAAARSRGVGRPGLRRRAAGGEPPSLV